MKLTASHLILAGSALFLSMVCGLGAAQPAAPSPTRSAEANRLNAQVKALTEQGKMSEALGLARQALAANQEAHGLKHQSTLTAMNNLGFVLQNSGDYAAAREYQEQALALKKEVLGPKHPDTATGLNNLGALLTEMGDHAGARRYLEESLAILREIFGLKHANTARALNNLGLLLQNQGDYAAARPYLEQTLAICRETSGPKHALTAMALNNMGFLLQSMGDYEGARPYYEQALAINQEVLGPKHPATATSLSNMGYLLSALEKYTAAKPYYEQALAINREVLGPKHPATSISLNNVGTALESLREYAEAQRYYEESLAIRRESLDARHPAIANSLNNLGNLHRIQDEYDAAFPYYEQALAIRKHSLGVKHPDTAASLLNLSGISARKNQWEEAAAYFDEARRVIRWHVTRALPSLSAREQAVFLSKHDKGAFEGAMSLAWTRRDDSATTALSAGWLLNRKGVAHEALAQSALLARESRDPALRATVKQLLETRRRLAVVTLSQPRPGQEAQRSQQLAELERQEESLSRKIVESQGAAFQSDPWIDLAAVRQAIPPTATLVEIARFRVFDFAARGQQEKWQAEHYMAWIIPPLGAGEIQIVDLGEAQKLDGAVQAARTALAAAAGAAGTIADQGEPAAEKHVHKPLADLAAQLLEPLRKHLGDRKHLLLSPDSSLWLVPWSALPLADGRYAIEQYQIQYLISGRDLVASRPAPGQIARAVVMANPNFDLGPKETQAATRAVLRTAAAGETRLRSAGPLRSSGQLAKVARLPGTEAEAKAIAPELKTFTASEPLVYTDQWALEGVFKAVQRPKVLVLSTHGFFLPDQEVLPEKSLVATSDPRAAARTADGKTMENPLLRCGLLLAGCNARDESAPADEDGVLSGMEIVGVDLRGTELVVLSACETGLGQVRNGEGVAGLRQAFQLAGAQAVVATLWQIPDKESARLMTDFFTNLAAGQSKADALRNAQLAVIKNRRERYGAAHPFFWAAFTLTGG